VPCRFPDLSDDPVLRRNIRWTAERLKRDLVLVGGTDPIALYLVRVAIRLLEQLNDVAALMPTRSQLRAFTQAGRLVDESLRRGVEAMAWIVDERGLGGGREQDGLAWQLPLDRLWESYVESAVRREAAQVGADIKAARLGETTFPLHWSDPSHRTLGHLAPDFVMRRGRSVTVIDAKYKAHFAELDARAWYAFTEDAREEHRADLHQVLAYASLFEADVINARLVYPLRSSTWESLRSRGRDRSRAELFHGGRRVAVELQGLPFGSTGPVEQING
jgi:5-methylcytosine-specific restriction endonuclease McrBC regulatory subunit McrC